MKFKNILIWTLIGAALVFASIFFLQDTNQLVVTDQDGNIYFEDISCTAETDCGEEIYQSQDVEGTVNDFKSAYDFACEKSHCVLKGFDEDEGVVTG